MNLGDLPALAVAGIPATVIIFGLVEFTKKMGLSGRALTAASMAIGIVVATGLQLALEVPGTPAGWAVVVGVGLIYGMTASGVYDAINKRYPAVK